MNSNNDVRIKDIAQLAGVSVGTVDRVIHKRGKVSSRAQDKVMAVLKQINYRPNLIARTLGKSKRFSIAVLIPDPQSDEYWEQSCDGINKFAEEWAKYNVSIKPFYFDLFEKSSFKTAAEVSLGSCPDGLLSAPIFYNEAIEVFQQFSQSKIPFAFFNTNIPEARPFSYIGQDLYQSGKVGAELLDLICEGPGTYAVLHIYEDSHNSFHLAEKERGCKDYFKRKINAAEFKTIGININNALNLDLEGEIGNVLSNPQVKGLLVSTAKGTGLVASYLEKYNRRDIKLIGYDLVSENIEFLRKGYIQFLIHQNPQRQANLGMTYLANYLLFERKAPERNLLPLEIVSRENLDSFLCSINF